MVGDDRPDHPPVNLNMMPFCLCRHGKGAHRNGRGPCIGERRKQGAWVPCDCQLFRIDPDYARPDDYDRAREVSEHADHAEHPARPDHGEDSQ